MTAYVTTAAGRTFQLPVPLSWELNYTAGVPSDSFWVRCPWQAGQGTDPAEWVRFSAAEAGETVFSGVVDECEVNQGTEGLRLEVSGRGMAALLLDNEALGCDYLVATIEDILKDHVEPYRIARGTIAELPPVAGFSVENGSSEWQVLYDFARYHGGIAPRFDRTGRLVIAPWDDQSTRTPDPAGGMAAMTYREKRYGVLSEVLVRDRTTLAVQQVKDEAFIAQGGQCRRVLTMPGKSTYQAMRYSGNYQLNRSREERVRMEITLPRLFAVRDAAPAEIYLERPRVAGTWRVVQTETGVDDGGVFSRLTLGEP